MPDPTTAPDPTPPTAEPDGGAPDGGAPDGGVPDGGVPDGGVPDIAAVPGAVTLDQVKLALRRVKDPELNLNIVDLGLVYDMAVEGATVKIDMSLTSPGCPSGPEIMGDAEQQLRSLPGVADVQMNLVWSPPWSPERIEPRVRAYLGF